MRKLQGVLFWFLDFLGDGSLYCKSAFIQQTLKVRTISLYL